MVPDKFNIVDFGGFDLAGQYGEALPGIYDKIVDAHWNCVYIMCFGLKFADFDIAPQYMIPSMHDDHIELNGIISIDRNDVITVPSIEPPAPPPDPPIIQPLNVAENGIYTPPSGVDGYAPVTVNVSGGGSSPYEYVAPVYAEFSRGYVDNNMYFVQSNQMLVNFVNVYELPAGKYVVFIGETINNRLRAAFYNGKTFSDFEDYLLNSHSPMGTHIYAADVNITHNEQSDLSGNRLKERFYFTASQSGSLVVYTGNSTQRARTVVLRVIE